MLFQTYVRSIILSRTSLKTNEDGIGSRPLENQLPEAGPSGGPRSARTLLNLGELLPGRPGHRYDQASQRKARLSRPNRHQSEKVRLVRVIREGTDGHW